jgi:hypothetical protein
LLPVGAGAVTVPENARLLPGTMFRGAAIVPQVTEPPPAAIEQPAGAAQAVIVNPVGAVRRKIVIAYVFEEGLVSVNPNASPAVAPNIGLPLVAVSV